MWGSKNCKRFVTYFFSPREQIKQKKLQREYERDLEVMTSNLILLRHLAEISMSKRIDDGVEKQIHWKDYYGTMVDMRKQQVRTFLRVSEVWLLPPKVDLPRRGYEASKF